MHARAFVQPFCTPSGSEPLALFVSLIHESNHESRAHNDEIFRQAKDLFQFLRSLESTSSTFAKPLRSSKPTAKQINGLNRLALEDNRSTPLPSRVLYLRA